MICLLNNRGKKVEEKKLIIIYHHLFSCKKYLRLKSIVVLIDIYFPSGKEFVTKTS